MLQITHELLKKMQRIKGCLKTDYCQTIKKPEAKNVQDSDLTIWEGCQSPFKERAWHHRVRRRWVWNAAKLGFAGCQRNHAALDAGHQKPDVPRQSACKRKPQPSLQNSWGRTVDGKPDIESWEQTALRTSLGFEDWNTHKTDQLTTGDEIK